MRAGFQLTIPPEILEPRRRHLGVAHRVLDIPVAQVGLERPRVVPLVGKRVTAGVPEHMRMSLERQLGDLSRSLDHASKTSRGEWRSTLRREDERRLAGLLAL